MREDLALLGLGYCIAVLITAIAALIYWNFFEPENGDR